LQQLGSVFVRQLVMLISFDPHLNHQFVLGYLLQFMLIHYFEFFNFRQLTFLQLLLSLLLEVLTQLIE